jgi:hypothetical protein
MTTDLKQIDEDDGWQRESSAFHGPNVLIFPTFTFFRCAYSQHIIESLSSKFDGILS